MNKPETAKVASERFSSLVQSICCFKFAGVRNFLLQMWHRLHPFALTTFFVTFFVIVRVSGELLVVGRAGDWGKDLLRNTTPPNEPRIFLVTLPLPTDILKDENFINFFLFLNYYCGRIDICRKET